jgi:hypothetical protein
VCARKWCTQATRTRKCPQQLIQQRGEVRGVAAAQAVYPLARGHLERAKTVTCRFVPGVSAGGRHVTFSLPASQQVQMGLVLGAAAVRPYERCD